MQILTIEIQCNGNKNEEVVFSYKKVKPCYPQALLGNDIIERKPHHEHLGIQLDSELNFQSHIKEVIEKARRSIGMIKYQSKNISRGCA